MKHRSLKLFASIIIIFTFIFFAGCEQNKKNEQNKKYLIATDFKFPPFSFKNSNGEAMGIDVEIFKEIANNQKIAYEFKDFEFGSALFALESNKIDGIMASVIITEKRKEKYDFSLPYYKTKISLVTKNDNNQINKINDIKDKVVAVKAGSVSADFAEQTKTQYCFDIKYFEDSSTIYEEIKSGNSFACFEDFPSVMHAVSNGADLKIAIEDCGFASECGFAVIKNTNKDLLDKFNTGLEDLKKSGRYKEIINKYIKEDG